jgi:hypothetical protein
VANGSAVSWQHINLLGEYDFSDEKLQDTVGITPPKNWRTKGTHFWELQKEQKSKAGTALYKILSRVWYLCWNLTIYGRGCSLVFVSRCCVMPNTCWSPEEEQPLASNKEFLRAKRLLTPLKNDGLITC